MAPARPLRKAERMNDIFEPARRAGLYRTHEGRILAGVCSGIGRRIGADPWLARLLFILVTIPLPGSVFVFYAILWILMPDEYAQPPSRPTYPPYQAPHEPPPGG